MNRTTRPLQAASGIALLFFAAFGAAAAAQAAERQRVAVRHPNLLLNKKEIAAIKVKIREQAWAARLFRRVKAKAEKDGAVVETALA